MTDTACETMADVAARQRARSALGELPTAERAELLTDLLCELPAPVARRPLVQARNRITAHLHDLITAEYDAEVAARPGRHSAEMARAE